MFYAYIWGILQYSIDAVNQAVSCVSEGSYFTKKQFLISKSVEVFRWVGHRIKEVERLSEISRSLLSIRA